MGQTLRIIYFILLKETEEKRATSNSLFLHVSPSYMQSDDNYPLLSESNSWVLSSEAKCICWFKPGVHW